MKKSAVKFVDEVPPKARRQYPWREIADSLRARPGDWAVVAENLPSSVVWAINAGRIKHVHPERGFRAKARETRRAGSERVTGKLYMVYESELDEVAKRNGGRA